ncbi:Protein TRM32 [Bienertia sinuspersici]
MGKHLWRKHSYVRVEDDQPGCIWTVFRMMNHHPWHNVKKMLPYKKHKPHEKSPKSKELKPEEEHGFSNTLELQEDTTLNYSASVNSSSSRGGSASKRSIKARIKSLMKEKDNSTKSDILIEEQNVLLGNEERGYDTSAPTLMSLLKANPKLIRSISRGDESRSVKHGVHVKHKDSMKEDEFVGILELFNVDQDLFLTILDDVTPRKPRLVKSGTFPSRNPSIEKQPSKIEHKHNEVWPTRSSNERELRKVKSQGVARSSSLKESLERYGYLFDSSSNRAIKKHLSKSFRFANEKEFVLSSGFQGRRSFKDRLNLSESESLSSFTMSEPLHNKSDGEMKGLKVDSPRDFECSSKSQLHEQRQSVEEEIDTTTMTSNCETNAQEVCSQGDDDVEIVEWPISEESNNTRDSNEQFLEDYYNEDLQYVKFVLDIIGIDMEENQLQEWHNENQPLDPALFDGIEVCCPFEPKTSNKDVMCMSSSHRKLLFDLINEALIDIHEKSYSSFYPKALSYWCHVCPKTKGKSRNIEGFWEFVREYLSWRPELDPTLDGAVAHDLSKDKNGWVNLQVDSEGIGLELEELIFNELLDEIIC